MLTLTTVLNATKENLYRIVKVLRFGKSDVQTADEAVPYGIDSSPIKDMVAVFSETTVKGEPVIIGYLNKNQLAEPGELRTYSTDDQGNQKFYTWLKKDGTCEIGGSEDNMVRFSKLEEGFNKLRSDLNALVNLHNSHTHILALSTGSGTAAPTVSPATPSTANITAAKIEEIKTT